MVDVEPVEDSDSGVRIWIVVLVVFGALGLLGVPLWYFLNSAIGDTVTETTVSAEATVPQAAGAPPPTQPTPPTIQITTTRQYSSDCHHYWPAVQPTRRLVEGARRRWELPVPSH